MPPYGTGRVEDPHDPRDYQWREKVVSAPMVMLPPTLRLWQRGQVLDQGMTPQCVAYSITSIKMHHEFKESRRYPLFDPGELYSRCKEIDGMGGGDGTYVRAGLEVVRQRGEMTKDTEPRYFRVQQYFRLTDVQQIREALYLYGPVVIGISLDDGIYKPKVRNGSMMVPEPNGQVIGGHAMALFGYSERLKAFLVKNSWGLDWGLKGCAWLPYSHLTAYPDWDAHKTVDEKL